MPLCVRRTKKYVKYDGGFEELYDLAADPYELENEAGMMRTMPATSRRMRGMAAETPNLA